MKNSQYEITDPASLTPYDDDSSQARYLPYVPVFPYVRPASGLYEWQLSLAPVPMPVPIPIPFKPFSGMEENGADGGDPMADASFDEPMMDDLEAALPAWLGRKEELRLDVDGVNPQRTASGTIYSNFRPTLHWVARLYRVNSNRYRGYIWYKKGNTSYFPYTNVDISIKRLFAPESATITLSGGGAAKLMRTYKFKSPYYRQVSFEFDCAQGTTPLTSIQTHAHPNRPASLPNQTLSIQTVFRRTGFDVSNTPGGNVPLTGAGANARWSDAEMHDAMQVYWSRFQNAPQWAMWVFFASLHEQGTSLGGIMFDDIGPNHRQGTALFMDSFVASPPAGDPAPAAWVKRMCFWTAVHEMGHGFNLAHSWQKSLGTQWIPLANEPEARSFMNYPYNVSGGQAAFFANFDYRFSNNELLFMRHAPQEFVQMGNADWFDHHGFQQDIETTHAGWRLSVLPPRAGAEFEFLEPVVLELVLDNVSGDTQTVKQDVLDDEHLTVIIKKQGMDARQLVPFARRLHREKNTVVESGGALRASLFASVGRNGWDLAEPGEYLVQVAAQINGLSVVSQPLMLRINRPASYEEESLASDFFTENVGRALAFDGTQSLDRASDILAETAARLPRRLVSIHARVALGCAQSKDFKKLVIPESDARGFTSASAVRSKLQVISAKTKEAEKNLAVLTENPQKAAGSLSRTDYSYYVDQCRDCLDQGTIKKMVTREMSPSSNASELHRKKKSVNLGGGPKRKTKPAKMAKSSK